MRKACQFRLRSGVPDSKVLRMTETLPDRLSTNPKSPHYNEALLEKGVRILFDGAEKTNVEEYCVSEGWVRLAVGKTVDRHGNPLTIKLKGKVEPFMGTTPAAF